MILRKIIIFLSLIHFGVFDLSAKERFNFSVGKQVQILSDKAYRRTKDNVFEAIGNVVITHGANAMYGEKASLSFLTGLINIRGNVRYVGEKLTMYGPELEYNYKTKKVILKNARISSDNYTVLGKTLIRHEDGTITGTDAEYTTCRDCPESWSIFGGKVHITVGEYIKISHALIKVNGIVVMYLPYIVLPIKKNRETGLLFPKIKLDFDKGVVYKQPWFWAIDNSKDLTVTPSFYGKRGPGGEFEYRQVFGDRKWVEFNSIQSFDRIYEEGKDDDRDTGEMVSRNISNIEGTFDIGNNFNSYFRHINFTDLDMSRDFDDEANPLIYGPELESTAFLERRFSMLNIYAEGRFNRNMIVDSAKKFDHGYVQQLPKVKFSTTPMNIVSSNKFMLSNIALGLEGDYTIFKQNHLLENTYIRNAKRVNLSPYIDWNFGRLGPVNIKTNISLDYQRYKFPYEVENTFQKQGVVYETELSTEIYKIFGVAYKEKVDIEDVYRKNEKKIVKEKKKTNILGKLPLINDAYTKKTVFLEKSSYKHGQEFKLKHFFLTDQRTRGSERFDRQVREDSGLFDSVDTIKERQNEIGHASSKTTLPINNTFEIQWNNSLIRKSPNEYLFTQDEKYLRDNFSYEKIFYFNVSQGYDLKIESSELNDSLTRLKLDTGVNVNNFNINSTEYYFYSTNKHIFDFLVNYNNNYYDLRSYYRYNSFSQDSGGSGVLKTLSFGATLKFIETLQLKGDIDYNLDKKNTTQGRYGVIYSPRNNCWKLGINYKKDLIEKSLSFNVMINFNENNFTSLN